MPLPGHAANHVVFSLFNDLCLFAVSRCHYIFYLSLHMAWNFCVSDHDFARICFSTAVCCIEKFNKVFSVHDNKSILVNQNISIACKDLSHPYSSVGSMCHCRLVTERQ